MAEAVYYALGGRSADRQQRQRTGDETRSVKSKKLVVGGDVRALYKTLHSRTQFAFVIERGKLHHAGVPPHRATHQNRRKLDTFRTSLRCLPGGANRLFRRYIRMVRDRASVWCDLSPMALVSSVALNHERKQAPRV
jgi:hypothetical protein